MAHFGLINVLAQKYPLLHNNCTYATSPTITTLLSVQVHCHVFCNFLRKITFVVFCLLPCVTSPYKIWFICKGIQFSLKGGSFI